MINHIVFEWPYGGHFVLLEDYINDKWFIIELIVSIHRDLGTTAYEIEHLILLLELLAN